MATQRMRFFHWVFPSFPLFLTSKQPFNTVTESYMAPTHNETQLVTTQDPAKQTGATMLSQLSRHIEPLAHDFNPSRCQQVGRPQ